VSATPVLTTDDDDVDEVLGDGDKQVFFRSSKQDKGTW